MALTEAQRADARRHIGYGPVGAPQAGGGSFISYRFFVQQGLMEFRLSNLSVSEEALLVGTGSQVSPIFPNFTDDDTGTVYDGYLAICNVLEGKVAQASGNLDTDKAGEWTARKEEISHRVMLYNLWCRRLAQFLYIPLGSGSPLARTAANKGFMVN